MRSGYSPTDEDGSHGGTIRELPARVGALTRLGDSAKRLATAIAAALLAGFLGPRPAAASYAIGLGAGSLRLPGNDGQLARAAPDGESKGSVLIFWS